MRQDLTKEAERRLGSKLRGKWRLDRLIDVGGTAAVYAATHRNGSQVAIKILHEMYATHPETKQRFLEEGYVANKVKHPAVVSIIDDDQLDDGTAFLVMELLEGRSLEDQLKFSKTLGTAPVLFIADSVLGVLAKAHEAGIIHRDIKPPNIYLTTDGQVKVLDFGLARVKERSLKVSFLSAVKNKRVS